MKRERTIMVSMLILQLILWLGFLVHQSPRFAGSLTGGILAITAALLMIVPPLLYSATKRIPFFKEKITKRISMGTLLTWHVYTSIVGAILAILHTGHRFESNLGIWLTVMMMLTVLSGFTGRYFLSYSSKEVNEKQAELNLLATQYNQLINEIGKQPESGASHVVSNNLISRAFNSFVGTQGIATDPKSLLSHRALLLTESIADLEYAIKTHELLKRRTARWLKIHIITSSAFYILLILHIWSAIYFGLRYLR
ncbi:MULTISPECIES: hypothetical protein [Dyadobacter]|uniref:Iron reductase n=3 Tax=Dyadobacter TaxID=120831 RepID=A0A5R9K6I4_9BACT|nr:MULTISPECIES: hypothetical protein [Dyadobacter]TDE09404.1 hypothetical protein E0F88_30760 [Dyadobacter psychrotolerans]TLU89394.1 hypothetical protein FEM55_21870 [Dyadobacter sediminis]GGC05780.1 hypothetical protein GCM10011325_35840 [Dyadobacter sediminis]SKC20116.1 hypothetical protein SAMN05660293_05596 [Dyadobacter psychrophilus]